jgi:hypothetical protein
MTARKYYFLNPDVLHKKNNLFPVEANKPLGGEK